jgi:myo-inositol 2-dehydrogenase/D-chiro-inositol 1-dehydrogenase/scyllo-inositol 2-dehydrogenase (NAD+)
VEAAHRAPGRVTGALRVLVAGAGRAGLVHARNFAAGVPGAVLVGMADPDAGARDRAADELGCGAFEDPIAAAASDEVDAVVIASPTPTHAEIAVAALDAGRHVLCEKPLASTLEQARAIVEAAGRSSGTFAMGFMRRFDAGFARARERIDAGEIGEPVLVRSTGRGPGLPAGWALDPGVSGGLIAEVNSHDIDSVRWLSSREFESVYAVGRAAKRPDLAQEHPGFVDVVAVTAELSRGGIAQIDGACPAGYGYDARVEVYGTEGVLLVGDPRARSALVVRADGAVVDPVSSWRDLFAEAYRAQDAHLVRVARGDGEPRAGAVDGLRALEVVAAVNRSLETRGVVRLAPDVG